MFPSFFSLPSFPSLPFPFNPILAPYRLVSMHHSLNCSINESGVNQSQRASQLFFLEVHSPTNGDGISENTQTKLGITTCTCTLPYHQTPIVEIGMTSLRRISQTEGGWTAPCTTRPQQAVDHPELPVRHEEEFSCLVRSIHLLPSSPTSLTPTNVCHARSCDDAILRSLVQCSDCASGRPPIALTAVSPS